MSKLIHCTNQAVIDSVEDAASAACELLDKQFPGFDNGGITSNFRALLAESMMHMLKGRSLLDGSRGHFVSLPALVVDDAFFGNPLARGEAFLITKMTPSGLVALEPGRSSMKPLNVLTQAWATFDEAAKEAFDYIEGRVMTYEQAKAEMLLIKPVVKLDGANEGYQLLVDA